MALQTASPNTAESRVSVEDARRGACVRNLRKSARKMVGFARALAPSRRLMGLD
ncbi:MAG: hypothetical protein ROZ37_01395 [Aromatoleum sp.]|uniref:hypothetical protein n=1 Tax=Aromatoleum sp. TaxID=2307007 RepID=UPI002894BD83|nr:hypothetical protein [Aromatoleum sp.]MDT3668968.1 hypothetical protein [Aromatoleum sp.]